MKGPRRETADRTLSTTHSGRPLLHLPFPPGHFAATRGDRRQAHRHERTVIGGDPVVPLSAAAATAVDEHLFPIRAVEDADRFHQRAAIAESVARKRAIDMAREEAERTVVAMAAPGDGWPDERPAPTALERIAAISFSCRFGMGRSRLVAALPARDPTRPVEVVV